MVRWSGGKRGTPPTPFAENHFAKKSLAEMEGSPSPLITESLLSFSGIFSLKGLKMMLLYQMDQKGHIKDQKGLKIYENNTK